MKKKNLIKEILDLQDDLGCLYTRSNEAQQEIERAHSRHTHHVSDHRANDLLPQFTALCKKVETLTQFYNSLDCERRRHVTDIGILAGKIKNIEKVYDDHEQWLATREGSISALSKRITAIEQDNTRSYAVHHKEAFDDIYAKMKEQRGDYHDHIAQLVGENNAAHELIRKNSGVARECSNAQASEILKMKEQINKLRTDYLALVEKKKPVGRPKKGA